LKNENFNYDCGVDGDAGSAKAQTSDALVGEWCLVETKINSTCPRADVLTILPPDS
jgi:hypothetical protein